MCIAQRKRSLTRRWMNTKFSDPERINCFSTPAHQKKTWDKVLWKSRVLVWTTNSRQHVWTLSTFCKVKEAMHKRLHIVWFHLCVSLEKAKVKRQKIDQWSPGVLGEGMEKLTTKWKHRVVEGNGAGWCGTVGLDTWLYIFQNSYGCTSCNLYANVKKKKLIRMLWGPRMGYRMWQMNLTVTQIYKVASPKCVEKKKAGLNNVGKQCFDLYCKVKCEKNCTLKLCCSW